MVRYKNTIDELYEVTNMIQSVITIGAILTVIVLAISIVLTKATPAKSYAAYFPGFIFFGLGLILLLFATIIDKIKPFGLDAGLGGWGIACLFAAVISMIVTSIFDSYRNANA